jgi:hypothetical protein
MFLFMLLAFIIFKVYDNIVDNASQALIGVFGVISIVIGIIMFIMLLVTLPMKSIETNQFKIRYNVTMEVIEAYKEVKDVNIEKNYTILLDNIIDINKKIGENRFMMNNAFFKILYNERIADFDFITIKDLF